MCFHFDFKEIFLYFYFFASEQKQTNKQTDKKKHYFIFTAMHSWLFWIIKVFRSVGSVWSRSLHTEETH